MNNEAVVDYLLNGFKGKNLIGQKSKLNYWNQLIGKKQLIYVTKSDISNGLHKLPNKLLDDKTRKIFQIQIFQLQSIPLVERYDFNFFFFLLKLIDIYLSNPQRKNRTGGATMLLGQYHGGNPPY